MFVAYLFGALTMFVVGLVAGYFLGRGFKTPLWPPLRVSETSPSFVAQPVWPTLTNEDAMVEEVDEVVRRVAELERVRQEGEVDHGVSETEV